MTWGQWEMKVLNKGLYDVTNILKSAPAAMVTVDWGLGVWETGGFCRVKKKDDQLELLQ